MIKCYYVNHGKEMKVNKRENCFVPILFCWYKAITKLPTYFFMCITCIELNFSNNDRSWYDNCNT